MSESYEFFVIYKQAEDLSISIEPLVCCSYEDALFTVHSLMKKSLDENDLSLYVMEDNVSSPASKLKCETETGVQVGNIDSNKIRYFVKMVQPHSM